MENNFWTKLKSNVSEKYGQVKNSVSNKYNQVKDNVGEKYGKVKSSVKDKFDKVMTVDDNITNRGGKRKEPIQATQIEQVENVAQTEVDQDSNQNATIESTTKSNVAKDGIIDVKEEHEEKEEKKRELPWLIVNIISVILYSVFIFVTLDYNKSKTLTIILIVFEAIYILALIALLVLSKDKKKMKLRLKNYKSAIKIFKSVFSIVGLAMSISVLVSSTYFSFERLFSFLYMIFMIGFSFISVLINILSMIFRGKIQKKKEYITHLIKENIKEFKK